MKVKVFRYITSISASLSLLATNFSFIQPAEAQFGNIFGRCGLPGEASVTVHYLIHPRRGSKLYIEVEKEGTLGGVVGRELGPGTGASEFTTGICNRDGFRVKIYTPQECGKTLLAESRFSRVYNAEDVWIKEDGITISNGDALTGLTEAAKLTLTLVAAVKTGGTLSPKAIQAAQKFEPCFTKSPGCPMGPNEFQKMRADRCFSQALAIASQNQSSDISVSLGNRKVIKYFRSNGTGTLVRQDSGEIIQRYSGWHTSWAQIVAIRTDMVLFYDREAGKGEIYRIEPQGNLTFLYRYDGWRKTWSNISSLGNSRVRFVDDNNHSEIYSVNDRGVFSDAN